MTSIAQCRVHLLVEPLAETRGPSCAWYSSRESLLVRLTDNEGRSGWGETSLRPGVVEAARELGASLVGTDPLASNALVDLLQRSSADPWAVSALSIALDDLRARALDVPVAALYGGRRRGSVRPYASSAGYRPDRPPEEIWLADVEEARAAGFDAFKFRIGRFDPATEIPLLATVREQVAQGMDFMADGNGAYSAREAITIGRALEGLGFIWLEEPLNRERGNVRHPGYDALAAALDIAIAGGEGLTNRRDFHDLVTRRAVDIVQPDVTICGGIGEALFVAQLGALSNVACAPHAWGGAIALAATLQLLAVLPHPAEVPDRDGPFLEYDTFQNAMRTQLATSSFEVHDHLVTIPDGPGLGVEVDEDFVARYDVLAQS